MSTRRERFEQLAEIALDLGLALVRTAKIDPAWCPVDKQAQPERYNRFKAPQLTRWQETKPAERERNAYRGELATFGETHNFLVNLRGSGLFSFENDGTDELARFRALRRELEIPEPGFVVQSSAPDRLHFHYLHPLAEPEKVSLRLEGGALKMAANNAFVVPPSVHPCGAEYRWLALPASREGIPRLTEDQYRGLLERTGEQARETRTAIAEGALVENDHRGDAIFRLAVELVRWGHSEEEVLRLCDAWQRKHCRNPHPLAEVRRHVKGAFAWEKTGGAKTLAEFAAVELAAEPEVVVEQDGRLSYGGLTLTPATQITMRATPWLLKPQLVGDGLNLLAGNGGLGKSTYSLMLASRVTRGETESARPGDVIVITSEDAMDYAVNPRLVAAGADLERVVHMHASELGGSVLFPTYIEAFEKLVRSRPETRLLIIDPIVASLDMRIDSHKDQHMRVVLGQMHRLAQELGLAILMIAHLNKNEAGDASTRVMGSQGLYNASRSVIFVVNDPTAEGEHEGYRIAYQRKENYSGLAHPQRWKLEIVSLGDDPETGEPIEVPKMVWVEEAWELDREDLLSPAKRSTGRLEEAKEFLRTRLADGPMSSAEIREAAAAGGISRSTLYNAAEEIGVIRPRGHGAEGARWRLP